MPGTVLEGSGGAWVSGNESFEKSRALMDRVTGGRQGGRPWGDAKQRGTNEKAETHASSTRLSFPIATAYNSISVLLGVGQELA